MADRFEEFLNDLAGELRKAAEGAVWDIPMNHRTKDSISAYRASVGMVSACVMKVLEKHRTPAVQTEPSIGTQASLSEPETPSEPPAKTLDELLATDDEKLFDTVSERPRRRRSQGE